MQLINGDCLTEMTNIGNNSVDFIIIDPPYGTTPLTWDKIIDFTELWEQLKRIIKLNGVILIFGQEPFSSYVRLSNIKWYRYDWYWQKERLTNVFQVKKRPGKVVETISVFYKKQCKYYPQRTEHHGEPVKNKIGKNGSFSETLAGKKSFIKPFLYTDDGGRYPIQLLKINRDNNNKNIHPTQKPVALIDYFLKTYTNEKDTVLDPCMGSGTVGVSCKKLNRNFIGIEVGEEYFNSAQSRIENTQIDQRLF